MPTPKCEGGSSEQSWESSAVVSRAGYHLCFTAGLGGDVLRQQEPWGAAGKAAAARTSFSDGIHPKSPQLCCSQPSAETSAQSRWAFIELWWHSSHPELPSPLDGCASYPSHHCSALTLRAQEEAGLEGAAACCWAGTSAGAAPSPCTEGGRAGTCLLHAVSFPLLAAGAVGAADGSPR